MTTKKPQPPGQGVEVEAIVPGSRLDALGVKSGDMLHAVNGRQVQDLIDYLFFSDEEEMALQFSRLGKAYDVALTLEPGEESGLRLKQFKVKTCRNKCLFCFVSQLPKGLRKTLYVKDEDYRMSFLYGNYVTLGNLTDKERERIVSQRLSPLYISVHATDPDVRRELTGCHSGPDIMQELQHFSKNGIRMHTQIVLCPGFNDGAVLKRTLKDLASLYPYVLSIAIVPVGLTAYANPRLRPVEREDALKVLEEIDALQRRFIKKYGMSLVYGSDELYIKAGVAFPPLKQYDDMPQIENGVGMVPLFKSQGRSLKIPEAEGQARYVTVTGTSFYPTLQHLVQRFEKAGHNLKALAVENFLFGNSVTVAGLIAGRDVIRALQGHTPQADVLLVPDVMLKEGAHVFLDDVEVADLGRALKMKTLIIPSTPEGLLNGVTQ